MTCSNGLENIYPDGHYRANVGIKSLIASSWNAYQEGGIRLFGEKLSYFIKDKNLLIFNPKISPISIELFETRIEVGYRSKYVYNGIHHKVVPRTSDTVVEAGVAQGRDTATFGKLANRVIGFEPSPRNYTKSKNNLKEFGNVDIINKGLWNKQDELEIRYGESDGDDGFLRPDNDSGESVENIPVNALEAYSEQLGIDQIDFLKIEAEGAEPEIIEGIEELRPRNIVVNAGEERDGQPTGVEVMELLQPMGYKLVGMKRGHILFFTLEDVGHAAFRSEFK